MRRNSMTQDAPQYTYNYTPRVELFLGYTHFGTWSTNAATGNRMVGLNGGSASLAFNLNRYIGLVADFGGYDDSQLQLAGSGANQPVVVNASGTAYTFLGGPRLSFRNSTRFTPFAQALFGDVHATAVTISNCTGSLCTPLPAQDAFAMTAGAGLDIALTRHISLRAVQAEYMMTRFAALPATGPGTTQNDLRLSTGLVFRFGDIAPHAPLELACSIQPAIAYAGDPLTVTATATNLDPKRKAVYNWGTNGGTVSSENATTIVSTTGLAPGNYAVNAQVTPGLSCRTAGELHGGLHDPGAGSAYDHVFGGSRVGERGRYGDHHVAGQQPAEPHAHLFVLGHRRNGYRHYGDGHAGHKRRCAGSDHRHLQCRRRSRQVSLLHNQRECSGTTACRRSADERPVLDLL